MEYWNLDTEKAGPFMARFTRKFNDVDMNITQMVDLLIDLIPGSDRMHPAQNK